MSERCSVKGQFCLTAGDRKCSGCGESVCDNCAVENLCFSCCDRMRLYKLKELRLRELGGSPNVAKQKPWGPVKG